MTNNNHDTELAEAHLEAATRLAEAGKKNDGHLFGVAEALGDDLSGNANPYVPWSDPQIPFECDCGAVIYADTPHTH